MLRSIFGWVRTHNKQWQDTMRTMNSRLDFAMTLFPVCTWSDRFFIRQFRFATHLAQKIQNWPARAALWHPPTDWNENFQNTPFRKRGRPSQRWDDHLGQFAAQQFGNEHHWLIPVAISTLKLANLCKV